MKIWDGFIRGYHWLQLLLIVGCWYTAENAEMEWHMSLASCLAALWVTRVIWGFIGSENARFTSFVKGPGAVINYMSTIFSGKPHQAYNGHNPAGALMVLALLLVIGLQWFSGLMTTDEIFTEGPLVAYVSDETATLFSQLHHLIFNFIIGFAVVHIVAVIVYRAKGERLPEAMVSGKRKDLSESDVAAPALKNGLIAWGIFLPLWAASWYRISGSGGF